jgi:alpha-L-fucosidase 2
MSSTRREFLKSTVALATVPVGNQLAIATASSIATDRNTLWYAGEAKRWLEALPIGNGRIGGMVYGGIKTERIALTESTAWSGAPAENDVNPDGLEHLAAIRQLLFEDKYEEARSLCEKHILGRQNSFGTNLPLMDVTLAIKHADEVSQYRRSLSLDEGIAKVSYRADGHAFTREAFSSNPDNVLVIDLNCNTPGQLNLEVSFGALKIPGAVSGMAADTLVFRGDAFEHMHSNGKQGVQVECYMRALQSGGTIKHDEGRLQITNADAVTILVAIATSYGGNDAESSCTTALRMASSKSYAELRRAHVADHQPLFRRVQIDLGELVDASKQPTDQRRKALENGVTDPGLTSLFFQFGRYLTIAGSRANSPLPMALQGIWNDGLASSMGWTDDFHLDINTQQNYWLAEVGNLSESQTPLFMLIDGLRIHGRKTARELYGASGWVSHTVTNPWGYTAPGWGLGWGIFVTSGIWIALQMWEHFRFTGDIAFLRERVYPVFKESADFFLAYMVEHPRHRWLVTGPSDSPENAFRSASGASCSESMMPTCDRVLIYSLFTHLVEAEDILGMKSEFSSTLKAAREKLPPLQIGRYGQIQEWLDDLIEAQPNHRHTSHLIALYPEDQITVDKTPELAKAARITLERRISQPDWEDTEWSRANLVNYYARLRDPEAAYKHLVGLIAKATEDNLLTYSRGGVAGAAQNIFAIDGNTAGAAGLAEMLLQSHDEVIHLLPALPAAWPEGSIRGLCARGGFVVSIRWRANKLLSGTVFSEHNGVCRIRYGDGFVTRQMRPGQTELVTRESFVNQHT